MKAELRREQILRALCESDSPCSAAALAAHFKVSRQIIVGDIAILRAQGEDIIATPRGYIKGEQGSGIRHTVACLHSSEGMEQEMNIIVDNGCCIENVIVEHPVYGELIGQLNCSNRHDVQEFIDKVNSSSAAPLSGLTGGIHLHTLRCPDEAAFHRVTKELEKYGFIPEQ